MQEEEDCMHVNMLDLKCLKNHLCKCFMKKEMHSTRLLELKDLCLGE